MSSLTAAGVYGKGTGSGSIGVIGEANVANAVGVYGVSTSPDGFGVFARNNAGGRAIYAEGNVSQGLADNGLVKTMVYVNYSNSVSTIVRCYNSITNSSSGNCGFIILGTNSINGIRITDINFGFRVDDRFISVTGGSGQASVVNFFPNAQTIQIRGGSTISLDSFYVFVY